MQVTAGVLEENGRNSRESKTIQKLFGYSPWVILRGDSACGSQDGVGFGANPLTPELAMLEYLAAPAQFDGIDSKSSLAMSLIFNIY